MRYFIIFCVSALIGAMVINVLQVQNTNNPEDIFNYIKSGNAHAVKKLVEKHPEAVSLINEKKRQPLHEAVDRGQQEIIKILLIAGADVNAPDKEKQTPLFYSNRNDIMEYMLSIPTVDRNNVDMFGHTLLYYLCEFSIPDKVKILLDGGADPDFIIPGFGDGTAIIVASRHTNPTILQLLINKGANVNARAGKNKITALMTSVQESHINNVKVLLKGGAKIRMRDNYGNNIYYYLRTSKNPNNKQMKELLDKVYANPSFAKTIKTDFGNEAYLLESNEHTDNQT